MGLKLEHLGKESLALDDILLRPQFSELKSRKEVNLKTKIADFELMIPIIPAPMSTITEYKMAKAFSDMGSFGIIHRYLNHEKQIEEIKKLKKENCKIIAAAISTNDKKRIEKLVKTGANLLCIEVAYGYNKNSINTIKYLKKNYPNIKIMSGNIATGDAVEPLMDEGVDILRVGFGGGSVCTTRIKTGVGVPNAAALDDVKYNIWKYKDEKKRKEVSVILDGGIKNSGDIVKALALGADAVMVGRLVAGTDETPGEIIREGNSYKEYSGMASLKEQKKYKGNDTEDLYEEGVAIRVPYKGPVKDIIKNITQTMKAGFAYLGARNIKELRYKAFFIKITPNGFYESLPHAKSGKID